MILLDISLEQARILASNIKNDIRSYVQENQHAFDDFLKNKNRKCSNQFESGVKTSQQCVQLLGKSENF